jgi:tetratricopeptide (TPR) repeat protein
MAGKLTTYGLIIFSLFTFQSTLFAQDPVKIDSLENALKSANRKARFDILIALSSELARSDKDRSYALADEAISISKKRNDIKLEVAGYINKGYCHELNYEDSMALLLFEKALEISEKEHFNDGIADALFRIGRSFSYQKDYARSAEFLDKSLELAKTYKILKTEGQVLACKADNLRQSGRIDEAVSLYNEALRPAREAEDINTIGNIYSSLGAIFFAQGNFHEAINNYGQSRAMRIQQGNMLRVAQTDNNIANAYYSIARYEMAIEYYQKALPVFEKFRYSPGIASIYNGMAVIYFDQKLFDKSLEYHLKKLEISKASGNLREVGNTLNNIGNVYEKMTYDSLTAILGTDPEYIIARDKTGQYVQSYSKALDYYEQAMQIRKDLNDGQGLLSTMGNIGILYMHAGKPDISMDYLDQARKLSLEMNNTNELARDLMRIGQVLALKGQYDEAIRYLKQSLDYALQADIKALTEDIYRSLSGIYEKKNDYSQALAYYKLFSTMRDSLNRKETLNMIAEMQVKSESENAVKANELLLVKSKLNEARVKQQKILICFFIFIFIIISVMVFFLIRMNYKYRTKTKPSKQGIIFSGFWFRKFSLRLMRYFHWFL